MNKKLISLVLALLMCVSLWPAAAFAVDEPADVMSVEPTAEPVPEETPTPYEPVYHNYGPYDESVLAGRTVAFYVSVGGDIASFQWQYSRDGENWTNLNTTSYPSAATENLQFQAKASQDGYQYRCVITGMGGDTLTTGPATLTIIKPKALTIGEAILRQENYYTFTPSKTGEYAFCSFEYGGYVSSSSDMNLYLYLYDSNMNRIARDNTIVRELEGGQTYYVYSDYTGGERKVGVFDSDYSVTHQSYGDAVIAGVDVSFFVSPSTQPQSYQWQYSRDGETWTNLNTTSYPSAATDTLQFTAKATQDGFQYRCLMTYSGGAKLASDPATLSIVKATPLKVGATEVELTTNKRVFYSFKAAGTDNYSLYTLLDRSNYGGASVKFYDANMKPIEAEINYNYGNFSLNHRLTAGETYYFEISVPGQTDRQTSMPLVLTKGSSRITEQRPNYGYAISGEAVFSVSTAGNVTSYQWQYSRDGGETWANISASGNASAAESELRFATKITQNGYQYRCVVTFANGRTATTYPNTLTVTQPTFSDDAPYDRSAVAGDNVRFYANAYYNGDSGIDYQWQYSKDGKTWTNLNASSYPSAVTNELVFPVKATQNGYLYRCAAKVANGVTYSRAAKLTVIDPEVRIWDTEREYMPGMTAYLSVDTNFNAQSYQWQYSKDGKTWTNLSASSYPSAVNDYFEFTVKATQNGYQYRCVVTTAGGAEVVSEPAVISIVDASRIKLGEAAQVTNRDGYSYYWYTPATTADYTFYLITARGNYDRYYGGQSVIFDENMNVVSGTEGQSATARLEAGHRYYFRVTAFTPPEVDNTRVMLSRGNLRVTWQSGDFVYDTLIGGEARFYAEASQDALQYQWQYSRDGGATWGNINASGNASAATGYLRFAVKPSQEGYQYRCVITSADGKQVISEPGTLRFVTMEPEEPEVYDTENTRYAAEGQTVTIRAYGSYCEKYQWQYSRDGGATWADISTRTYPSAATTKLTFPAKLSQDGYQYRCVFTTGKDSVVSGGTVLHVAKPTALRLGHRTSTSLLHEGDFASFSFTPSVTGRYLFNTDNYASVTFGTADEPNGSTSTSDTAPIYVQMEAGTTYYFTVRNLYEARTKVQITRLMPGITQNPYSHDVVAGDNANFYVYTTEPAETWQWQYSKNGETWTDISTKTYPSAATSNLTFPTKASQNGYQYRCVATFVNGEVFTSRAATLFIVDPVITNQNYIRSAIPGAVATFYVNTNTSNVQSYQWQYSKNGSSWTNLSAATYPSANTNYLSFTARAGQDGYQYRCVVKFANGQTATSEPATLRIVPVQTITLGMSTTAVIEDGGYVYYRFVPETTGSYVFYSQANSDTYGYLFDRNLNEIMRNDDGGDNTNFRIETYLNAGETYYFGVRFYNETNSGSIPVTLTMQGYELSGPYNVNAAAGNTVSFSVSSTVAPSSYRWQFSRDGGETWANISPSSYPSASTDTLEFPAKYTQDGYQYRCVVSYDNGLELTSRAAILTVEQPRITTQPVSHTVLTGTEVSFYIYTNDYSVQSYQWQYSKDGTTWVNISTSSYPSAAENSLYFKTKASQNGYQYRCVVRFENGVVVTSDPATLTLTGVNKTLYPGGYQIAFIENGGDYDYFCFVPETSGYYAFYSEADRDTYGYLYDSDMNEMVRNDDGGENNNFRIETYLNAGETYYLGVRYYSGSNIGSFEVYAESMS